MCPFTLVPIFEMMIESPLEVVCQANIIKIFGNRSRKNKNLDTDI